MAENEIEIGYSQFTAGANGLISFVGQCLGAPSVVAIGAGIFAPLCYLLQRDASTGFQTVVWRNDGTTAAPSWTQVATLDANVVTAKVTLSSAQILALHTTPIQLIAAPGAGKVIDVLGVTARTNFLTAAYGTNTELDITDATAGTILLKDTANVLGATSTKVFKVEPSIASNAALLVTANGAVNATVATGDPATGAGSVDIYITYKVITL